jgi:hypothetical protein
MTPTQIHNLINAAVSMFNICGAAKLGAQSPAHKGLDVDYHAENLRKALSEIDNLDEIISEG